MDMKYRHWYHTAVAWVIPIFVGFWCSLPWTSNQVFSSAIAIWTGLCSALLIENFLPQWYDDGE